MKTTNYEISKQLAEAKFKANQVWNQEGQFWGYDLETILEALPDEVYFQSKKWFLSFDKCGCNYVIVETLINVSRIYFSGLDIAREENESLADTAAKLWLKLKREGLV